MSFRGPNDLRQPDKSRNISLPIETQCVVQKILTDVANILHEKGAGHLSDEIEIAAPNQLPAIVEAIDIGGFHEEATELRKVVSEIFTSFNHRKT